MTVREKIHKIMHDSFNIDNVNDDADLFTTYNFDSCDGIELTQAVEEEFNVLIPDDDLDRINTVGHFISWVESELKKVKPYLEPKG